MIFFFIHFIYLLSLRTTEKYRIKKCLTNNGKENPAKLYDKSKKIRKIEKEVKKRNRNNTCHIWHLNI